MGSFVRRVKTASGATAVQVVRKRGRVVAGIDHIGSAHDDGQLELLLHAARERLHAGQQALELAETGVDAPSRATFARCLRRIIKQDYCRTVSDACYTHAIRCGYNV